LLIAHPIDSLVASLVPHTLRISNVGRRMHAPQALLGELPIIVQAARAAGQYFARALDGPIE
jgi:hypothetical protein